MNSTLQPHSYFLNIQVHSVLPLINLTLINNFIHCLFNAGTLYRPHRRRPLTSYSLHGWEKMTSFLYTFVTLATFCLSFLPLSGKQMFKAEAVWSYACKHIKSSSYEFQQWYRFVLCFHLCFYTKYPYLIIVGNGSLHFSTCMFWCELRVYLLLIYDWIMLKINAYCHQTSRLSGVLISQRPVKAFYYLLLVQHSLTCRFTM